MADHEEGQRAAFSRPGSVAWLDRAADCLKEEAKLLGMYRPPKAPVLDDAEGFRIAGMSTQELDKKMMALVLEKIENTHEEDVTL